MFEDYIQDSFTFFGIAESAVNTDERAARMYFRASVFCAASALEAFVNFIGESFNQAPQMDPNERAFLNDKTLEVSASKGTVEDRVRYHAIDSKVKFIIKRFNVPLDPLLSSQWRGFKEFKRFRDSLVHPRALNDEISLSDYVDNIKSGLNANIDIMNSISSTIFGKPLRQSLLDLKL
jgi:hypothetical protein